MYYFKLKKERKKEKILTSSISHNTTVAFFSANLNASSLPNPLAAPVIKTISLFMGVLATGKKHLKIAVKYANRIFPINIKKSKKSRRAEYRLFDFSALIFFLCLQSDA